MLSGKPSKFLYLDDKFYYLGDDQLSGKNSYLVVPGPRLQRLLRPGRLCTKNGECGWLVIRKRRNAWYVYLDTGQEKEVYLGPLARFQPAPISLIIRYTGDGKLSVDIDPAPGSPKELIGAAKSLTVIVDLLGQVRKLLNEISRKYKLRR